VAAPCLPGIGSRSATPNATCHRRNGSSQDTAARPSSSGASSLSWNAAGGIIWATGVALIAYYLGDAAASAFGTYGLFAAGGVILLTAIGYLIVRRLEKRFVEAEQPEPMEPVEPD
jgi:hypothetical protein